MCGQTETQAFDEGTAVGQTSSRQAESAIRGEGTLNDPALSLPAAMTLTPRLGLLYPPSSLLGCTLSYHPIPLIHPWAQMKLLLATVPSGAHESKL